MRHFAALLKDQGWQVEYQKLDDKRAHKSISESISKALKRHKCKKIVMTEAAEYRLQQSLLQLRDSLDCPFDILEDDRFYEPGQ